MGPSDAMPIALATTLFGPAGTFDYTPPYLDTPRQSIRQKAELARAMARPFSNNPEPPPMTGIVEQGPGPPEHATAFRMWLIELYVRRHYGNVRGVPATPEQCRAIQTELIWIARAADHLLKLCVGLVLPIP
jgi:hypothetical protein